MKGKIIIVTNNPLVLKELGDEQDVVYIETSYEGILKEIRDLVHKGFALLTHPLSGSVKPKETPYKSVLMSSAAAKKTEKNTGENKEDNEKKSPVDSESLSLIENAIQACRKFQDKSGMYPPETIEDFSLIDLDLIKGAIASAYI